MIMLKNMGFTDEENNCKILNRCNGNLEETIDNLIEETSKKNNVDIKEIPNYRFL